VGTTTVGDAVIVSVGVAVDTGVSVATSVSTTEVWGAAEVSVGAAVAVAAGWTRATDVDVGGDSCVGVDVGVCVGCKTVIVTGWRLSPLALTTRSS
jgi:hypothetical protein